MIRLAALHPGIGKGAQTHMGEHRGLVAGDRPPQVEHHAKGQGIGRHLVGADELGDLGRVGKVPGYHGIQQARSPKPGQSAAVGPVAAGADAAHRRQGSGASQALIPFRQGG